MSSRHLPRVIGGQRGKSTLEVEREHFEKNQTVAINKAINTQETPVKEKHLRNTILGTFTDHGGGLFWHVTTKQMQLQANPILCWKFCHVLHKLLREGHENVFIDSQKYRTFLEELGKLWGHLRDGYGRLIAAYTVLLNQKLVFHKKYPNIPGNLLMTDDVFARICGSDVNGYFEISVDMLDYMDEVLNLQKQVFGSLDRARANSMTNSGQCRLAPLILCIQDSCQLYDYIVKILFKLHSSLPPDTLSGHRDRFLAQYKKLKEFYFQSSNLQYFKNLVTVPLLPDDPPNFLIQSDFNKHVKPVAVVEEPEPEPERESITPEPEIVTDLIDTSEDRFDATFGSRQESFNFNGGPPEVDERDLLIERLTKEIQQLRAELERVKSEDQRIISSLRDDISKLEKILSELRLSADKALQDNENLKAELSKAKVHMGAAAKLTEAEKHTKASEEKFKKMKDVYQKLRDEHVTLLRQHGDLNKQNAADKKALEEKEQVIKDNEANMVRMEDERKVIQESLQNSADEVTQQLAQTTAKNTDLEKVKQELETQLKSVQNSEETLQKELQSEQSRVQNLESQVEQLSEEKAGQEEKLTNQIEGLQSNLDSLKGEKENMEKDLQAQIATLKTTLAATEQSKAQTEQDLSKQLEELEQKLETLMEEKQSTETRLTQILDDLHRKMLSSSIAEGRAFIQDALDQFHNQTFTTARCTAEFLLLRAEPVIKSLEKLESANTVYSADKKDLENLVECITGFSHHLGDCVIHGIATSQSTAEIESGQHLANHCRSAGESGLTLLAAVEKGGNISSEVSATVNHIKQLMSLTEELVPKSDDVKTEEIGDMVDSEMQLTSKAIEQAAAKIQEMLQKTREGDSGVQLEVNERILDACTDLMKCIKILVEKSRDLQQEIVAQGRGTSTAKDFYKKNHRWTEGFISAAKAVGWGATTLMEAADKVVKGEGKLEQLIVCSQEIAASTAQLVVSSRVKAKRGSNALQNVQDASKGVSRATGNVVATVKTGAQIIEEKSLMDFTHLSLIQTKKQEMDSQVRVLELERELEIERQRLSVLRKQHYTLAAETEGDQEGEEVSVVIYNVYKYIQTLCTVNATCSLSLSKVYHIMKCA
ncbi:huntingtin-interacting protein 1-like isoform X2 [Ruditapes philippinarum]|uniref:huntingtin-interacting protein 1-like isoform X2 n=1 Tax=Ruditapes philippinarum TaxID=129788 RepID=UPI00295B7640|nr:huntingtin-interacting protein 1-like isoform X2 [Ruditapes philippinarum]